MLDHSASAPRSPTNRSRSTNDLRRLAGIRAYSPIGRRYRDLVDAFVAALGGDETKLNEAQRVSIRRAAELSTLTEEQRAKALRGEVIDPLALVRLEGAADRAVRALNLKPSAPRVPSIAEALAAGRGDAAA
jgi:hypothetical protein